MSANHMWGMKRATLDKWLKALESKEYTQIYTWGGGSNCCVLGVLGEINRCNPLMHVCDIARKVIKSEVKSCEQTGIDIPFESYFIGKNDQEKMTFPQLADHIRKVVKPIDEL